MTTQITPSPRHSIQHWACLNAWKLAGLTAFVTILGLIIAVSLSLLLRPTRSYFFPLLSDVDKHHPERAVLRLAFVAASLLLFATTTASVLHLRALHFCNDASLAPSLLTTKELSPVRGAHDNSTTLVDTALRGSPSTHYHPRDAAQLPLQTGVRRRRFSSLRFLVVLLVVLTVLIILRQNGALHHDVSSVLRWGYLSKLFTYTVLLTWCTAVCVLVWYFLKLQTMPDRVVELDADVEGAIAEVTGPDTGGHCVHKLKTWATWLIVLLRPICLTGQVVCVIKIVGLWLALDTFSISNIGLVKKALLAALAFAEYTTAFFFAFFMTILAVDMRSKSFDFAMVHT